MYIDEHFQRCVSVFPGRSCRPTIHIKVNHILTIRNTTQEARSKTATQGHDAKWKILNSRWRHRDQDCSSLSFFYAMLLTATRWWCWSPFSVLLRFVFFVVVFFGGPWGSERQTLQWIRVWLSPDRDIEECWRGLNKEGREMSDTSTGRKPERLGERWHWSQAFEKSERKRDTVHFNDLTRHGWFVSVVKKIQLLFCEFWTLVLYSSDKWLASFWHTQKVCFAGVKANDGAYGCVFVCSFEKEF